MFHDATCPKAFVARPMLPTRLFQLSRKVDLLRAVSSHSITIAMDASDHRDEFIGSPTLY